MISILIPFFLTTRLAVDDNAWQYGPEYKFKVDINFNLHNIESPSAGYDAFATNHLYCRLKNSDTMNCHMKTFHSAVNETDSLTNESSITIGNNTETYDMDGMSFEMKFDQKGVHSIITPTNWTIWEFYKYQMVRAVAELLSVGTGLTNKADGKFDEMQTFILGECMTNCNFEHVPRSNEENPVEGGSFELNLVSPLEKKSGEDIYLTKSRDFNNCVSAVTTNFISELIVEKRSGLLVNEPIYTHQIHITDDTFVSTIKILATASFDEKNTLMNITEIYKLTLEDIVPAQNELPKVDNPTSSPFFVPSELEPDN